MATKPKNERPRGIGDNSRKVAKTETPRVDNRAKAELREYFERIERVQEEIDALNAGKSEIYSEARANGYDVKIMKIVVSRRAMDRAELLERDALVDLYESVLKGLPAKAGTNSATRARAEDAEDDGDE